MIINTTPRNIRNDLLPSMELQTLATPTVLDVCGDTSITPKATRK
jgi:hypothetical protein